MKDISDVIARQVAKVDKARSDLATEERVLAALQDLLAESNSQKVATVTPVKEERPGQYLDEIINLAELDSPAGGRKSRLLDDVRETVSRFGGQTFNVGQTEGAMKRLNKDLPQGKTPRTKISQLLAALCEDGYITRMRTGKGNAPNLYKLTAALTEQDKALLQAQKSPGPLTTGLGV